MTKYRKMQLLKVIDGAIEVADDIKESIAAKSIVIVKDDKAFRKLLRELTSVYTNGLEKKSEEALTEIISYVVEIGEKNFSESDAAEIKSMLEQKLGKDLPALIEENVLELHSKVYKFGMNEVGRSANMRLSYDINDKEAAAILGNQNLFWVGNHYDETLSKDFDKILSGYFEGDKSMEDIANDFEAQFKSKMDSSESYFQGLAEHAVNRTRELGKVTGYEKAEIVTYEIVAVLDDHTSEICETMNGKKFSVTQAVSFRDEILNASSPEEIKSIAPWRQPEEVKGLSAEEMPAGMELPPYHFRCRTQTVAYFE